MRSIPSAPTLAPWSRTVGRPICWWSRATSRGWSRRSTGSVSRRFPPAHRTVDRGHGRIEQRTTWVAPAASAPARVRRSWPPCATWPSGCYGRLDRPGSLPGYATSVVILPARWRSSAFHELPRTPQPRSSRGPGATHRAGSPSCGWEGALPPQPLWLLERLAAVAPHDQRGQVGQAGESPLDLREQLVGREDLPGITWTGTRDAGVGWGRL